MDLSAKLGLCILCGEPVYKGEEYECNDIVHIECYLDNYTQDLDSKPCICGTFDKDGNEQWCH